MTSTNVGGARCGKVGGIGRAGLLCLLMMMVAAATAALAEDRLQSPTVCVLVLEDAAGLGKPLKLHLDVSGGRIRAALATGLNAVVHDVDRRDLKVEGPAIRGTVKLTINPDSYIPADGKAVSCVFAVDSRLEADRISGSYEGTFGGEVRRGRISGEAAAAPDYSQPFCLKARLLGALHRLYAARGPNWKYALDMNLICRMQDGKVVRPRFETIVPDYRRYSAVVESCELALRDNRLAGSFVARVDYGGQGKGYPQPIEVHAYTLEATVVGNTVGGTYEVKIGKDYSARGVRFVGTLDFSPPPDAKQSIAFIRLHDAMKEGPVILNLSLADDGRINGFGFASGYNHQVHSVDASKLKVEGRTLNGTVTVAIAPDCYRPPERFKLEYEIKAQIEDDAVFGTFSGVDRGSRVEGKLSGELRAKRPATQPATQGAARTVELRLGYSLVRGKAPTKDWEKFPMNHANVRFTLEGDRVTKVEVHNPQDPKVFSAKVVESELRLDGDCLSGSVAFDLTSEAVEGGRYAFGFEAIVDGENLSGWWRGTHNSKDILTKSAKLGGTIAAEAR